MKVTAIKQQVKRKDRYSVYVDESYEFSLSQNGLLQSGLRSGDELTQQDIERFRQQSEEDKIYERLLYLLSFRPRSEWELTSYLARKKIDGELAEKLINRLRNKNYIDDEDFARRWVENRRLLKPVSKRKLYQELKVKRVDNEAIEIVLSEDDTDEREVLAELILKKRSQTKYKDPQKLLQFLARQGFNYDDIKTVLAELD